MDTRRRRELAGVVTTASLALLATGGPAALIAQEGLEGLEGEIAQMVSAWELPGLSVAIIQDDEVTFARGFGVRTVGTRELVDENTTFAVGSTSKAFTAAAVAMLVDEGKVGLDDLVIDHLPDFRLSDPYVTRSMRVRDLMAHNSGLLRGDRIWYGTGRSREDVLHRARYQPLTHPLRATFEYNNIMWIAAGELVEEKSGMSWDQFIEERIFSPLNMGKSTTTVRDLEHMGNVASPHVETPEGERRPVPYRNIDNAGPAGSINSSALQMAQWVRLHLGEGKYEGRRLISEAQVKESHTGQMIMRTDGTWGMIFPESDFLTYGLGWFLSEYRGLKMVSHGGNIDGMTAFVGFIPERDYGFVLLANLNGANGFMSALAHRIIDRFEGDPVQDWSGRMAKAWETLQEQAREQARKVEEGRIAGTSSTLTLEEYAGTYSNSMYGDVVISHDGTELRASYGEDFEGPLEHWHYDTFRAVWEDAGDSKEFMRFEIGTDGAVRAVHAEIEGSVEFRKKAEDEAQPAGS
ncbi:MAG: serine hydrolase [Gemmatimonadota bacterium]|nr:serine hydrolase [Gemmatimonadota bacterium]